MLTSKPPFQSSTTDEIYRRARERDYEWPTIETCQKYISQEAKDLVASMLEDADMRPDPDSIVQHPFFTSGYMPVTSDITPRLRELPPESQEFYVDRMTPQMQAQASKNLKDMCRECGVGPWTPVQVIHTQVWKEVAAEEKSGLTPVIPLVEGIVYRPFDQWLREQQQQQQRVLARPALHSAPTQDDMATVPQKEPSGLLRAPPQSFAAQQRAQNRPAMAAVTTSGIKPRVQAEPVPTSQSLRARPKRDAIVTMETKSKEPAYSYKTLPTSSSSERVRLVTDRPSSKLSTALIEKPKPAPVPVVEAPSAKEKEKSKVMKSTTLFSPQEHPMEIPGSRPDTILERLQRLQGELERALNTRTMAIISTKDVTPPLPYVVVKWVDYTHKFGLGYILNDGSVGCALRDIPTTEGSQTALLPPACMIVRGAERHIQRRQDETYLDRHHPAPLSENIDFFENHGEKGLCQVSIPARHFKVPTLPDGTVGKLRAGKDLFEHRKRERVILWKKFANYMIAHGRDDAVPVEETDVDLPGAKNANAQAADVVTFYQRFGDVGCWVFCDGHLQVRDIFPSKRALGIFG
jgi:hypothetical protein